MVTICYDDYGRDVQRPNKQFKHLFCNLFVHCTVDTLACNHNANMRKLRMGEIFANIL